jgi:rhodanese-related sulfurtransferase
MMLVIIAGLIPSTVAAFGFSLETTQKSIEKKYSNINHIDGSHFLKLNTEKTLIFDIRQQNEFDVSHIKKAIRVDPNITNKGFMDKFGLQVKGQNVVFYCSVGWRSSALVSHLQPLLLKQGADKIYNLKGGIFQWRNEQRILIQNGQPTQFVHPFNPLWGVLLKDKNSIKFFPEKIPTKSSVSQ